MFDQLLKDKVAFVTGGTRGIGLAIAQKLATLQASVFIFGMDQERGHQAEKFLRQASGSEKVFFKQLDVSKTDEVQEIIPKLIQETGSIDILINNAGITRDKLLLRMEEKDWDDVLDVNAKSCYNMTKACSRAMMKARQGKILNVSSVIGLTGNAGQSNYSASKAAVIGLTKAIAKELAPRNICVNCIAPGFIDTKMTDVLTDEQRKGILEKIPLGRIGNPEEVADLAAFLVSSLSNYITGQVFVIDGGMVI